MRFLSLKQCQIVSVDQVRTARFAQQARDIRAAFACDEGGFLAVVDGNPAPDICAVEVFDQDSVAAFKGAFDAFNARREQRLQDEWQSRQLGCLQ